MYLGCGHIVVRHQDHIGFLDNGVLHCKIPRDRIDESEYEFDTFINDDSYVLVKHHFSLSDIPLELSEGKFAFDTKNHVLGVGCGHESVLHGDHYDYLINNQLIHINPENGNCENHGLITIIDKNANINAHTKKALKLLLICVRLIWKRFNKKGN